MANRAAAFEVHHCYTGHGMKPKVVQHRLGHSSITVTSDTYGHLFPRGDDGERT